MGNTSRTRATALHHKTSEEAKETLEHIHQNAALMKHIDQDDPQDSTCNPKQHNL